MGKTTQTTSGRHYPQFTSMGTGYDTLVSVTTRLASLALKDAAHGPSDGRETERGALVEDLQTFAAQHGAQDPRAAVEMALGTVRYVHSIPGTPVLSVLEEIEIATSHTNKGRRHND